MFEYIASRDGSDQEKLAAVMRGPEAGEIAATAYETGKIGYHTVYTVYCPAEKITRKWCADFAEQAAEKTGNEIFRVQVQKTNGDLVVYWTKQNCLRVYQDGNCIYENNNGVICTDVVALMDSGCGNPYAY